MSVRRSLKISCLPKDVPSSIKVDVSGLDLGDSIHISDATLGEGIESLLDEKLTIVVMAIPTAVKKAMKEAEAEEEEAAEA